MRLPDRFTLDEIISCFRSLYADLADLDGVTNGDSHDHSGGDGAQIDHTGLSNLNSATYTHLTATNHTDLTDGGDTTLHTHAAYVAKATYDAQTILAATSNDTPAALTVGEQTVVGRISSGNIAALTVAQLQALMYSSAITENVDITFAVPSGDTKYSGIVMAGTAGATLAFGDVCYFAVADSRWELADADSEAKSFGLLGICVLAAANDGSATKMLMQGRVNASTAFPSFTVGAPVYLSATDGDLTNTAPSGAGDCIRCVGHAITADEIWFEPSRDWFEHA